MPQVHRIPWQAWRRDVLGTWVLTAAGPAGIALAVGRGQLVIWFCVAWTSLMLLAACNGTRRASARLELDERSIAQHYPLSPRRTWRFQAAQIRRWSVIENDALEAIAWLRIVSPEVRELMAAEAAESDGKADPRIDRPDRRWRFLFECNGDSLVYEVLPDLTWQQNAPAIRQWFETHVGPAAEGEEAVYRDDGVLSRVLSEDGPFEREPLWDLPEPPPKVR